MAKRIAFFLGQVFEDYARDIAKVVTTEAIRFGYQVEVFCNFGTYGDNYLHVEGEKNIIELPYIENYSGIIIAPDTFDIAGMYDELSEKLDRTAKCPIVNLRFEDKRFYNVMIDNQGAMEEMVSHLIEVHGLKKICFMTGKMEMKDAQMRLQGYRNVMEKYHLPVTEHMIYYGDYWRNHGEEAVDWFLSDPNDLPEAIVCSNDYMAVSVCDALRKRKIDIPQQIRVTGFDNLDETKYSDPPIASMEVPIRAMGCAAVELIDHVVKGIPAAKEVYVPVTPCYHGTCGCPDHEKENSVQILYEQKQYLIHAFSQMTYLNVDLESCNTMEELFLVAYKYTFNFQYDSMFVCMCDHTKSTEVISGAEHYTEQMILKAVFSTTKGSKFCDEKFERRNLLPEEYLNPKMAFFLFPLHYKNHCMGYIVLQTQELESLRRFFVAWLLYFSNFLDKVRMYQEHHELMEFRQLSITDEMTGLHNRREMEKILRLKYHEMKIDKNKFYVMSVDMDGLKCINDTYGHLEGDKALCAFADILKRISNVNISCARVGGDEFTVCVATEDEEYVRKIEEDIQTRIAHYNKTSGKPYEISASIGFARCDENFSLVECMQKSDEAMYVRKRMNKHSRSYVGDSL